MRFEYKTAFLRKRRSAVFTVGFLPDKKIYVCRRARFAVFRELAEAFDQFRFRARKGGVDKTLLVWRLRFASNSSTETLKKRERRNKADAVDSLRPFSDFAIADRLSPVALANCC